MDDWMKGIMGVFKSELVALAFAGSLIAQSFWPSVSSRAALIAVSVGTVVSCATSPALVSFLEWKWPGFPHTIQGAIHFWAGLMGMQIVPIVSHFLNKLKDAKIPGVDQ
jgi:Na+/proline symporter